MLIFGHCILGSNIFEIPTPKLVRRNMKRSPDSFALRQNLYDFSGQYK